MFESLESINSFTKFDLRVLQHTVQLLRKSYTCSAVPFDAEQVLEKQPFIDVCLGLDEVDQLATEPEVDFPANEVLSLLVIPTT